VSSQTDLKNYQKILKQFKDHFEISCGSPYVFQTCLILGYRLKGLFGSVVAVAFQIAFRAKMHVNDVFLFFKNYF
jgi:hypothetical protein